MLRPSRQPVDDQNSMMTRCDTGKAAPSEKRASRAWLRALELTSPIGNASQRTFPTVIEELAEKFGGAPALLAEDESLSFRTLNERANRYARWAQTQDVHKGDTVCLLMTNRPEYMAIWLGITRAGGVVALLNTNLVGTSLAHCIDLVAPKHVIVASDLAAIFENARPFLATPAKIWSHGAGMPHYPDVGVELASFPGDPLAAYERTSVSIDDRALYVYTSGTTGLPK